MLQECKYLPTFALKVVKKLSTDFPCHNLNKNLLALGGTNLGRVNLGSIVLTGMTLISGSWLIFKILWLTLLLSLPILTWMGFFLLIWPKLMLRSGVLEFAQELVEE